MLRPISPPPRSEPQQPHLLSELSIQDRHTLPKKLSMFNSEPTTAAASCEIEEETEGRAPDHAADHAAETAAAASSKVVVVLDAEKKPSITALDWAMSEVCKEGDEITVLAYLQHIMSPMGHKMVADLERFIGVNEACLVMTTSEKLDAIEYKMKETGRRQACQKRKIKLEVQIAPGSVAKSVIVREITAINATWVIFEKNTINDRKYFTECLTSQNVVRMKSDGRSVETICLPNQSLQTSVSMASELSSYSSVNSPTKTLELPTISSAVPPLSSPPSSVSSSLWGRLKSSMGSRHNSNSSPTTSS
ncbi:unnamed protein product [Sphagnum jensenii]|uniref:Uncharacterized protein n=1 Tax=Sphagnum jensenii TaxID=128206 RepID=A0ABP1BIN2_9BRYO